MPADQGHSAHSDWDICNCVGRPDRRGRVGVFGTQALIVVVLLQHFCVLHICSLQLDLLAAFLITDSTWPVTVVFCARATAAAVR